MHKQNQIIDKIIQRQSKNHKCVIKSRINYKWKIVVATYGYVICRLV